MLFLYLMTWVALVIQISIVTISVAAGLYYLAELVEEYTVMTKKVVGWMILVTIGIYVGFFLFEEFPLSLILGGLIGQVSHLLILKTFPYVIVMSPPFVIAVIMLIVNHYLAFNYFGNVYHSFSEVLSYFTLCLWMVPFVLFVSLSANENVLPTHAETQPLLGGDNDVVSNYFSKKGKKYGLLSFFNYAKESILPQRNKKSF